MRVVIIEDETAAARNLQAIIRKTISDAEIVQVIESVADTVEWFGRNEPPDLLFMDIHLADGEAFRIFDSVDIDCPIIFTTAYDEYAIKAFKVNSIDYLLKPIKEDELRQAIDKLRRLSQSDLARRRESIAGVAGSRDGERLFLIPVRDRIVPLKVEDVAFFYTADEKVKAYDFAGNTYPMDRSLDKLMKTLSGQTFFRANRQFIVAREAIGDITVWFGSRLSLNLKIKTPERIVVSKDRVPEFKRWFVGN